MNRFASVKLSVWVLIFFSASVFAGSAYTLFYSPTDNGFPNEKYLSDWKTVDSLQELRLSKQASEKVLSIYTKAKAAHNTPQIVKTLIHQLKFRTELEEDAYETFIKDLDKEILEADPVLQSILYSLKGEIVWQYYQNNRWEINERTVTGELNEDMTSWDASKFMDESRKNFMLSLKNDEELKEIPIEKIEDILLTDELFRPLRPTLYDFLAHRALDFFMNAEANLNKPVYVFELDKPSFFSDYHEFVNINLKTQDTLSSELFAFKQFQNILRFHSKGRTESALIDADLKRLEYVYSHYVGINKDSLYLQSLLRLKERFQGSKESPVIILSLANYYKTQGNSYRLSDGENDKKYYLQKAVQLCDEIINNFNTSWLEPAAYNLKQEILAPSLSFNLENVYSPDVSNLFLLRFENLNKAHFKVVSVNYEEYKKQVQNYEVYNAWLLKLPAVKTWEQDLPDDKLYHSHSVELELPPLKKGFYILMASDSKEFTDSKSNSHYAPFFVSDLGYISKSPYGQGNFEAIIQNRNSGEPIKGAEVSLYERKYDQVKRDYKNVLVTKLKSDAMGRVSYGGEGYFSITIKYGNDFLASTENYSVYKSYPKDEKSINTHFFTDRGIYRPGQTIYFKGIKIKTDGKQNSLLTNGTAEVYLYDANSQEISNQKLSVNEFGSFQGSFEIPLGLATGSYYIREEHGTKYIQVEEYKRPKFEVTVSKPKEVFRVNDKIKVKGNAKALAGFNITNAKVQYRVYRTANFPIWYRYWYPVDVDEQEITYGITSTDDKGEFTIEFTALADKKVSEVSDPTFNYRVLVEVTDEAGETRTAEETVSAGYKTLTVTADIPALIESGNVKPWFVSVMNLNGQAQKQSVNVKIEKLKKPENIYRSKLWGKPDIYLINEADYKKKFPNESYKDEVNKLLLPVEETVYNNIYNTADTIGFITPLNSLKSGIYRVIITTKDPFGKEAKAVNFFTVFDAKEKTSPVNEFFFASALESMVEPGSTARFYLATSKKIKVLYEIEHEQKTIKREFIDLNNEQRIISIPVIEEYRGNIDVSFTCMYEGRNYSKHFTVYVPFTNKQLNVKLETFRDKMLPGSKEEWKINVAPLLGQKQQAELLLTMYDASLDAFVSNSWFMNIWHSNSPLNYWSSSAGRLASSNQFSYYGGIYKEVEPHDYELLNWFGISFYRYYTLRGASGENLDMSGGVYFSTMTGDAEKSAVMPSPAQQKLSRNKNESTRQEIDESLEAGNVAADDLSGLPMEGKETGGANIKARSNFSETAFFFPQIKTDMNGNATFSFTMPESLTKWKFMGMAHTKNLQVGYINKEMVTQKELMINTFAPRFLREGDELYFTGKVTNLTEKELSGKALLELRDAITDKNIASEFGLSNIEIPFSVKPGQSVPVEWKIKIPFERSLVKYSVKAISGNFSDGEENVLPILTNRMLVTETLPLWVNGNDTKNFNLPKLNTQTSTMRNHKLTLEFTSNPAWYAVQSLPYLMEYPYECAEQTFSRLYANSIATHIANSDPKIKAVFDTWRKYQPDALQSKLEKNQELKNLLLEETPWVQEAKNESERKHRVGILFDINRMDAERKTTLRKLGDMQLGNGGFPWFKGGPDDRYITQHIVTGFGKLQKLGVNDYNPSENNMVKEAIIYMDKRINEDYEYLIKHKVDLNQNNLGSIQIHYLYARSFFNNIPVDDLNKTAVNYYFEQAKKYWKNQDDYSMGMISLVMFRANKTTHAETIIASLKDRSIYNEELGMYWKGMLQGGYYWYNSPIESMSLLIEAFDEVTDDTKSVDAMRRWLLKNKQTNDWRTTKATADATYALLLQGTNLLMTEPGIKISFGKNAEIPFTIPTNTEAGTGYFKTDFSKEEIKPYMSNITINKQTTGPAWGAMYWQYFENLDKITKPTTPNPLKVSKKIFRENKTDRGLVLEEITAQTKLGPGDRIISRIILVSDRPMEYVHLKDMRASGLEPENVISSYKYQQGLGYYESTRDVVTHFFISYVPRGTFVFEYPSRVTHRGNFSNGITQIQCMYAPEFTFHSEGIRVNIK